MNLNAFKISQENWVPLKYSDMSLYYTLVPYRPLSPPFSNKYLSTMIQALSLHPRCSGS